MSVSFTPTDSTDFIPITDTVSINVNPAVLTVAADDASMVYGSALPDLTVSYSGFVNGDNTISLTTEPSVSTTATSESPIGSYPITVSGAADPNYTFNYVDGTLTVTPVTQTITFGPLGSTTYGVPPITLNATGGGSAQPVIFQVVSGPGTISGNQLTVTGVGVIVVEADQAADGYYAAATPVQQILTVTTSEASRQAASTYAVGSDAGATAEVKIYDTTTGALVVDLHPFGNFTGGARVAVVDINDTPEVIVGAGPGGGPQVNVYNGRTGQLLTAFYGLAPSFTGGVFVSAGSSSSGQVWIAVGAGAGGGPQVAVYDLQPVLTGDSASPTLLASFFAFNRSFTGGTTVALGDVNGDGKLDVIAGAGPGGGPQVVVVDGTKLNHIQSNGMLSGDALLSSFYAYLDTSRAASSSRAA